MINKWIKGENLKTIMNILKYKRSIEFVKQVQDAVKKWQEYNKK